VANNARGRLHSVTDRDVLVLADGRRIEYLEFGDPQGAPAIYLHGTPSSAQEARWLHSSAVTHGVRLVSVDRPGYHGSEPSRTHGVETAGRDVAEAATLLSLERYAVVGFSGGAGCALAVAAAAPHAVSVVHLGGGMGPSIDGARDLLPLSRRVPFWIIARSPRAARLLLGLMSKQMRKALGKKVHIPSLAALELLEGSSRGLQYAAAEAFARATSPEDLRAWVTEYVDGSGAIDAVRADISSLSRPWPFHLGRLETPVELWHGTADGAVPIQYGQALAQQLPNAQFHSLDGEGHFVFLTHGDEVCASVRARSRT
jgi:pimeloyl-ACP methyl ester carboxylesterase